ncbi:MAG: FAD-dependent monooxygenase [Variibacter sp.]|nr:FAD-dependent monooxygenase [Variibacter sp.]
MREADVVVVGGGLAGSAAAGMLGRAGFRVAVIDPHTTYPPDFRCEKLDGGQVRILRKTGLADTVLRAATADGESWIARNGRLLEKRAGDQHGILYDDLVNTVRTTWTREVDFIHAKVAGLETGPDRQVARLAGGEEVGGRLVVLANGLNSGLRQAFGMRRRDLSPGHSIAIGFDLAPAGRQGFPFSSLTYYGERPAARVAYLTLFPIGPSLRANLMVYRSMDDPWLREMRHNPTEALATILPRLRDVAGPFEVVGPVKIRPADLYVTEGIERAGVVLVGDAYATSCPAAGTGAGRALHDVERLCNIHIPRWFESAGMDAAKIAEFYADPVKRAYDRFCREKAFRLRLLSTEEGVIWSLRRGARFAARWGLGATREMRRRLGASPPKVDAAKADGPFGRTA